MISAGLHTGRRQAVCWLEANLGWGHLHRLMAGRLAAGARGFLSSRGLAWAHSHGGCVHMFPCAVREGRHHWASAFPASAYLMLVILMSQGQSRFKEWGCRF